MQSFPARNRTKNKIRSHDWWERIVKNEFKDEDWLENFRVTKDTFHFIVNELKKSFTTKGKCFEYVSEYCNCGKEDGSFSLFFRKLL